MKTYLSLRNEHKRQLPEEFRNDDVRYCEELVEHFLSKYTSVEDTVLDPFMGFGTTLVVAEKLGRIAYGVEYDKNRHHYVLGLLQHPERALHGDSTKLSELPLPKFAFSITSPPYMGHHHKENPFTAYSTIGEGYGQYLDTIRHIYKQVNDKLKPSGRAVIEVSNLKHADAPLTTLAWDIAREVSKVMHFEGETVVTWENGYAFGYDHSYCLLFGKK